MRTTEAIGAGLVLTILMVSDPAPVRAQAACVEHCGAVSCGGTPECGELYETCVKNCRNGAAAPPDGWVVLALSAPDFAVGVAHGFTSKEAAAVEAVTACRRNRGTDCQVVWRKIHHAGRRLVRRDGKTGCGKLAPRFAFTLEWVEFMIKSTDAAAVVGAHGHDRQLGDSVLWIHGAAVDGRRSCHRLSGPRLDFDQRMSIQPRLVRRVEE